VLVGAVVTGVALLRTGPGDDTQPTPPLSPTPTVVDPDGENPAATDRPLLYAEGSTIHAGERAIRANARVQLVDATDDGVVFMTDLDRRVWFDDGSTPEVIGEARSLHVGDYPVWTAAPGSLVVWREGIGPKPDLVVYDTSQGAEVGRIHDADLLTVLGIGADAVYLNPDWSETPGCWVVDRRPCADPRLLRFDPLTGTTDEVSADAYRADLGANARMFAGVTSSRTGLDLAPVGVTFTRAQRRLVPTDPGLARVGGQPVRLEWPGAATVADPAEGFWVTQWLDDDLVVLAGFQDNGDGADGVGQADSYAASYVDLLVCALTSSVCEVVVPRSSDTPYLPPGQRGSHE